MSVGPKIGTRGHFWSRYILKRRPNVAQKLLFLFKVWPFGQLFKRAHYLKIFLKNHKSSSGTKLELKSFASKIDFATTELSYKQRRLFNQGKSVLGIRFLL